MYLFIVIFSLISLLQDEKIKSILSKQYNKTRKRFYKRIKKESKKSDKVQDNMEHDQKFFGKK
jgi:hypothetical protein